MEELVSRKAGWWNCLCRNCMSYCKWK